MASNVDKYAVLGNPIAHSKSPIIHAEFAKQTNQNISYEAILTPIDGFTKTIEDLIKQGYKGVNVTVPFKSEAFRLVSAVAPEPNVLDAGAVNTLLFTDDGIKKDNTDGVGLVSDIQINLGVSIANKRILLLGAGGAAEGVLHPLLEKHPDLLVIHNRTLEKALSLVKKVTEKDGIRLHSLSACSLSDLENQQFDIIINATSTGLTDTALPIPDTIFAENCLAYDMMYGRETPFMVQARNAGATVADGLGMLVEQAAEAFYIWRNVRPNTQPVIQMLRTK